MALFYISLAYSQVGLDFYSQPAQGSTHSLKENKQDNLERALESERQKLVVAKREMLALRSQLAALQASPDKGVLNSALETKLVKNSKDEYLQVLKPSEELVKFLRMLDEERLAREKAEVLHGLSERENVVLQSALNDMKSEMKGCLVIPALMDAFVDIAELTRAILANP